MLALWLSGVPMTTVLPHTRPLIEWASMAPVAAVDDEKLAVNRVLTVPPPMASEKEPFVTVGRSCDPVV